MTLKVTTTTAKISKTTWNNHCNRRKVQIGRAVQDSLSLFVSVFLPPFATPFCFVSLFLNLFLFFSTRLWLGTVSVSLYYLWLIRPSLCLSQSFSALSKAVSLSVCLSLSLSVSVCLSLSLSLSFSFWSGCERVKYASILTLILVPWAHSGSLPH